MLTIAAIRESVQNLKEYETPGASFTMGVSKSDTTSAMRTNTKLTELTAIAIIAGILLFKVRTITSPP